MPLYRRSLRDAPANDARRRWRMVAFCARPGFRRQFERRLEHIHEPSRRGIQFGQQGCSRDAFDSAGSLQDDGSPRRSSAPGLIVLLVRSAAGKLRTFPSAPPSTVSFMNTLSLSVSNPRIGIGISVCITPRTSVKRRCSRNSKRKLRPARREVGEDQRLNEAAARRWARVCDEISLEKTGLWITPAGEGPNWNHATHRRRWPIGCSASGGTVDADRPKRTVDRRSAHR